MGFPTLSALRLAPVVSVDATATESFRAAFRIFSRVSTWSKGMCGAHCANTICAILSPL